MGATTPPLLGGKASRDLAAFIATDEPIEQIDRQLLGGVLRNIAVGLENVALFSRLHEYAFYHQLSRLPTRNRFIALLDEWLDQPPPAATPSPSSTSMDSARSTTRWVSATATDRRQAVADRISKAMAWPPARVVARIS